MRYRNIYTVILVIILLSQLGVELLPLLFDKGSSGEEYIYYIGMRSFYVGFFPSIILYLFCKTVINKIIALTLVFMQLIWVVREAISYIFGLDWLVLTYSHIDVCIIFFILTPITLSIITNATIYICCGRNSHLLILLQRCIKGEEINFRNK